MRQQKGASQQVLFPEIIEFTAAEAAVLPVLLEDMRFIGFDLSNLGNNSYAINGLPAGLENVDQLVLIKDIVNRATRQDVKYMKRSVKHRFVSGKSSSHPSRVKHCLRRDGSPDRTLFSCPGFQPDSRRKDDHFHAD